MTATKSKPEPVSPAVASRQAAWHCRQAAGHFCDSENGRRTAQYRASARRRFVTDTKLALPTLGLDDFLALFKIYNGSDFREAEPIIRELAAELQGNPLELAAMAAPYSGKHAGLVKQLLAAAMKLIEDEPETSGQVETRGGANE